MLQWEWESFCMFSFRPKVLCSLMGVAGRSVEGGVKKAYHSVKAWGVGFEWFQWFWLQAWWFLWVFSWFSRWESCTRCWMWGQIPWVIGTLLLKFLVWPFCRPPLHVVLLHVISFVYMEKRMSDKTQPCWTPVIKTIAVFKTVHSDMLGCVPLEKSLIH